MRIVWILVAAAVCVAYVPLLAYRFGYLDDYAMLMVDGYRESNPWLLGSGRPAAGVLMAAAFGWMTDISDLAAARAATILQVAAAAVLLARGAAPFTGHPAAGAFAVAAVCTLPFQVMASWAVFVVQMPGLLLSLAVTPLALRLAEGRRGRLAAAGGLAAGILAVLCFYQPYAAAYWIVLAALWLSERDARRIVRGMLLNLVVFGAANLLYVVLLRVVKTHVLDLNPAEHGFAAALTRGGLVDLSSLAGKVVWFMTEVLPRLLVPVQQAPGFAAVAVAALLAATGLWLGTATRGAVPAGTRLAGFCGWGLSLGVAASAILASAESDLTFRTIGIPAAVALLPMVLAVVAAARRLRLERPAAAMVMAGAASLAMAGVKTGFALPQAAEVSAVRERLAATDAAPASRWAIVAPGEDPSRLPGTIAEPGMLSSATHWGAIGLVWLLLDEQGRPAAPENVRYLPRPDSPSGITFTRQGTFMVPAEGAAIVDLRGLAADLSRRSQR